MIKITFIVNKYGWKKKKRNKFNLKKKNNKIKIKI